MYPARFATIPLLAGLLPSCGGFPGPAPPAPPAVPEATATLGLLNAGRARSGARPFALDARLSAAAQAHADDMASGRVPMGHSGFPDRLHAAGFPRTSPVSEGVFGMMPGFGWDYWVEFLVDNPNEAHGRDFRDPTYTNVGVGHAAGRAGEFGVLDYGGPP